MKYAKPNVVGTPPQGRSHFAFSVATVNMGDDGDGVVGDANTVR